MTKRAGKAVSREDQKWRGDRTLREGIEIAGLERKDGKE